MRKTYRIIFMALLLSFTFFLVSCNKKEVKTHDINFLNSDGTVFTFATVEHGKDYALPTNGPDLSGYNFKGWSMTNNDLKDITNNLDVLPIYEKDSQTYYVLLFYKSFGKEKELLTTKLVGDQFDVSVINVPDIDKYKFVNWDQNLSNISNSLVVNTIYHKITFYEKLNISAAASVLLAIFIMLFVGFLFTRVTKPLKLPNVTAYIFAGIFIGPLFYAIFGFNLIQATVVAGMDFLTDIALAFIAFGVGRFLKLDVLKKSGKSIIIITLFESIMASILVFLAMFFIFKINFELSLLLAAIASATAPASTMMTIRQTRAKGDFVNTILQVVTLDDAVSLILFSISIAIITAVEDTGGFNIMLIVTPILLNLLVVVMGIIFGIIVHLLNNKTRSTDNRLIIAIAFLAGFSGIAAIIDISPLLGVMAMGMTYVNVSKDESLFRQLDYFSPPILSIFFILSGMRLQLHMLATMGLAGVVYFIVRIIGKYSGATLGSVVANSTENNKKYLGLALIPQAGVSLGLAALGSRTLISYGLHNEAAILSTIIIASGVLYEVFGPPSAKLSLYLSHSYDVPGREKPEGLE